MSKHTSGELIMIFGIKEIFILNLCFPLKTDEARSILFLGVHAGSLGLFRTREHA
jgi:hypothetical protein